MTERIFPKTNITNDPEIDFFVLPDFIANEYYAKIQGLSEVLVDYYVEVTDNFGNVTKSKIQHVWVGENLNVNPSITFSPTENYSETELDVIISAQDSTDPNPIIYYTTDGTTPTLTSSSAVGSIVINITQTTTFKAFAVDFEGNQSEVVTKTYNIGELEGFTVYFKPPQDWTLAPNVYWWGAQPTGAISETSWPGETMQVHDEDWYKYSFTGISSINLIFNKGEINGIVNVNQTEDITGVTQEIWYEWGEGLVLSTNQFETNQTKVFPNPVQSVIRIDSKTQFQDYVIFDVSGKKVINGTIYNHQINVSNLAKGVYLLQLSAGNQTRIIKFIK
jgi:hypothetical protein